MENKNKKFIIPAVLGLGILSSTFIFGYLNYNPENKKEEVKEKINITAFEENDAKRSKYKGYTVEEVFINGEKVKIDVQSHGDHYHIIYKEKNTN